MLLFFGSQGIYSLRGTAFLPYGYQAGQPLTWVGSGFAPHNPNSSTSKNYRASLDCAGEQASSVHPLWVNLLSVIGVWQSLQKPCISKEEGPPSSYSCLWSGQQTAEVTCTSISNTIYSKSRTTWAKSIHHKTYWKGPLSFWTNLPGREIFQGIRAVSSWTLVPWLWPRRPRIPRNYSLF